MVRAFKKMTYPWYSTAKKNDPIEQGDIIVDCQIIRPHVEAKQAEQRLSADAKIYDVIVMSQSCDLQANKIDIVLVCPLYTLTELGDNFSDYKTPNMKERLRNGWVVGHHLLNKCNIKEKEDFLIVDFKNVFGVPLDFLKHLISSRGDRKRLLPPYREHLSQSFARFFMRVGLPVDIPPFK